MGMGVEVASHLEARGIADAANSIPIRCTKFSSNIRATCGVGNVRNGETEYGRPHWNVVMLHDQSPGSRANTTTLLAGITIAAEAGSPCMGPLFAVIAPPLPTPQGFTQLS